MRISKLRVLDKLRRVRLEMPVYRGGDRVMDLLLAQGLVIGVPTPSGSRIGLSGTGAEAIREMAHAEAHGALRGCWGAGVSRPVCAWLDRFREAAAAIRHAVNREHQ